jgi:hypothetical protein
MSFSFFRKKEFLYPCKDSNISCYPVEVFLPAGVYQFECYGANGGTSGNGRCGYGAYVSGNIKLNSSKQMFLFIGAQGHTTVGQPSFNGGGRGHLNPSSESLGASGGGSTDIRLKNSTELDGLVSRIIVAGAGGGGESYLLGAKGGNAGIFSAEGGVISKCIQPYPSEITSSEGANISNPGNGGKCVISNNDACDSIRHGHSGGFGFGGGGSDDNYGGGGGSGYFGGGGGAIANCMVGSGAGGSSYVSGYRGFHTFDIVNGVFKDTNTENHSSGLIFFDVVLKDGNETKYDGNGKVVITRIILMTTLYKNKLKKYCYLVYSSFIFLFS